MQLAFVLRFQEDCENADSTFADVSNATATKIRREGPDTAMMDARLQVLPQIKHNAATGTNTRISREQGDADRANSSKAMPVVSTEGTKTATAVRMESGDPIRASEHMVLPRCC